MNTLSSRSAGGLLLLLFVISGFAGLIYQSVWSQYLGLTLGHAAYAQTLVLAIFMGGMAIGAWFISRHTPSWQRLIFGYALIEGLIGIIGLTFQPLFEFYTGFSQQVVLPSINQPGIAHSYQWITAALLILPQSVLLGATFPLLSSGYLRIAPREDGQVLGGLYFTNSLGAAIGALATTFVLLPMFGLPGTVFTAGLLNILVALGAWMVSKAIGEGTSLPLASIEKKAATSASRPDTPETGSLRVLTRVMLIATALSGATSFIYEIGWIRLLNQALGTTIHSFELMLAAFILGLAFGGLWIRRRSSSITAPIRYVGYAQIFMGIAALLSIPMFAQSFHWTSWLIGALSPNTSGYVLFEVGTAVISLLVMFPAAFFAGMTLPLFTMSLLRAGADERVIGRIYAANTLGAIAGVAFMVHALIPLMGVKLSLLLAAVIDAMLGLYLLHIAAPARVTRGVWAAVIALMAAMWISSMLGRVDPTVQTSGVFRTGYSEASSSIKVPFLKDGKTATVALKLAPRGDMGIMTNGKSDAAIMLTDGPPGADEITMYTLGIMPLVAHPNPQEVAIIGWGSGLSTHTLLGSPVPQQVNTIEIERVMHEAARLFGDRVVRAYEDPRSKVHFEDARTFFSTGRRNYDVIISEPSNPWVSGVAGLFTQEFYRFLNGHLKDDGVLVQWLHLYEISEPLVATMLSALAGEFPHTQAYLVNDTDLVIVAYKGVPEPLRDTPWQSSGLKKELARVGLGSLNDLTLRRLGNTDILRTYIRMQNVRPHSDYFPVVSLQAPRDRFMRKHASFLPDLTISGLPVLDMLSCEMPLPDNTELLEQGDISPLARARVAGQLIKDMILGDRKTEKIRTLTLQYEHALTYALIQTQARPDTPEAMQKWSHAISVLARATIGFLPAPDLQGLWTGSISWLPPEVLQHPAAAIILQAYRAAAERNAAEMYENAKIVLEAKDAGFDPEMREQMLVIGILGAIASGHMEAAQKLEADHASNVARSFYNIRNYLMVWASEKTPVCRP